MDNINGLLQTLTQELRARNLTIATAESCTGGLMASYLTELSGSSVWFERGFVTYSNRAKVEMLGVSDMLIQQHGAVSEVVAEAMAHGALHYSAANVSISITGIAGPDGGSPAKPVGTVCFAYAIGEKNIYSERFHFANANRQQVRLLSCQHAFEKMTALIRNY